MSMERFETGGSGEGPILDAISIRSEWCIDCIEIAAYFWAGSRPHHAKF
jgi:hypothetical protein